MSQSDCPIATPCARLHSAKVLDARQLYFKGRARAQSFRLEGHRISAGIPYSSRKVIRQRQPSRLPRFPSGLTRSDRFAEMSKDAKNAISHRFRALEKLRDYLAKHPSFCNDQRTASQSDAPDRS